MRERAKIRFRKEGLPRFTKAEVLPLLPFLPSSGPIHAVDVGANKGIWSKAMLNTLGKRIERIDLFDPSPENCRELRNQEDNLMFDDSDFGILHVHEYAVGRESGRVVLHTNDDGSPLASLYSHAEGGFPPKMAHIKLDRQIEVEMRALDDVMDAEGIERTDILKIDTEGHELDVLLGASRRLKDKAIGAIVFEFGCHQVESRNFFKDFYSLFKKYDYSLFETSVMEFKAIDRYDYKFEDFRKNFIFLAKA